MATALAYAPDGALSHRDAAALLGLRRHARATVEVTVPRRARARAGVLVHMSETLGPDDVVVEEGIPCTSVARTLVDLGDVLDRRAVERAVEQAEILQRLDVRAVDEALARAGPRHGAAVLRVVLGQGLGETLTANELEERFLEICRSAALPQPAVNVWGADPTEETKVDFLWRHERLIAETDGRETHATRQAFERDRLRDQRLTLAGWRVVRFTHRQVTREPGRVARTVGALLAR
jgi:very-short-patch-repair endonuclease